MEDESGSDRRVKIGADLKGSDVVAEVRRTTLPLLGQDLIEVINHKSPKPKIEQPRNVQMPILLPPSLIYPNSSHIHQL